MNSNCEKVLVELAQQKPAFSPLRSIAAPTIGNALEFYDFRFWPPLLLPHEAES